MPIQEDRVRDDRDSEQDRKRRKILSPDPINGEAKISRVNVSDEPTSAEVTDVKEPEVEIERRRQRVKDWQVSAWGI